MLTFFKGRPVVKVTGDLNDGKILYLDTEDSAKSEIIPDMYDVLSEGQLRKIKKGLTLRQLKMLEKCFRGQERPQDETIEDLYDALLDEARIGKLYTTNGFCQIIPTLEENQRDLLYICGPSGSGKSHYTGEYIKYFKKLFPEREVYIFSNVDEDPVLDDLDVMRVTKDIVNLKPNTIKEFTDLHDSLVIFDDTDTISDKLTLNNITCLKNSILEEGRHYNVYCVITSHLISNFLKTRTVLNESNKVTIFPKSGSVKHIKAFFNIYCGLNNKEIDKILKLDSRWITICKNYPQHIVWEHGVQLL